MTSYVRHWGCPVLTPSTRLKVASIPEQKPVAPGVPYQSPIQELYKYCLNLAL